MDWVLSVGITGTWLTPCGHLVLNVRTGAYVCACVCVCVCVCVQVYLAVRKHGVGNWAAIARECRLPNRTNVDIKDKWRTMKNQSRLRQLRVKFGPVKRTA